MGLTQIYLSNLYINNILILKSDFGKIQDQSEFRITSPNRMANENSQRREGYLNYKRDNSNKVKLLKLNDLNDFLVSKPNVIQIPDLFQMRFFYVKGIIAKILNKYNRRSERAVLNSGVIKTLLKFNECSAEAPHKV